MTRKFVLHVGTEKTGTTSIQEVLANNRPVLAQQKCLFPVSFGDRAQVAITGCCFEYNPAIPILMLLGISSEETMTAHRDRVLLALQSELNQSDYQQVIISDEHIAAYLSTSARRSRLRNLLANFGMVSEIVLYLRRQDMFLASLMGEAVKGKAFHAFNYREPINTFHLLQYQYNYPAIIKGLQEDFPDAELVVRGYSESPDFDVVDDFLQVVPVAQGIQKQAGQRQNRALPGSAIEPLGKLGSLATMRGSEPILQQWNTIVLAASESFAGRPFALDQLATHEFLTRFSRANAALSQQFPSLAPVLDELHDAAPDPTVPVPFDEFCRQIADRLEPSLAQALSELTAPISGDADDDAFFPPEIIAKWQRVSAANHRLEPTEWGLRPA